MSSKLIGLATRTILQVGNPLALFGGDHSAATNIAAVMSRVEIPGALVGWVRPPVSVIP